MSELFDVGPLRFELVDSSRNRRRFYELRIERDRQLSLAGESGGWVLVVARGRLGDKAVVRREPFSSPTLALERWGELARARRRHGYSEVASSCSATLEP